MSAGRRILGGMDTSSARVPGTSRTAPGSVRSGKDVACGLRAMETSKLTDDLDYGLNQSILANRFLGVGVPNLIERLQHAGKLPACGTDEWERLVALAELGQIAIAPVLMIGDRDYACDPVVEDRIRGGSAPAPAPPPPPAPPKAAPASLASEIAGWRGKPAAWSSRTTPVRQAWIGGEPDPRRVRGLYAARSDVAAGRVPQHGPALTDSGGSVTGQRQDIRWCSGPAGG